MVSFVTGRHLSIFLLSCSALSCRREFIATLMILIVYHIVRALIISSRTCKSHSNTSTTRKYSLSIEHYLIRRSLVTLFLLLEWNWQSVQSLFVINRSFKIKESFQEKNFTSRWYFATSSLRVMALNASLVSNTGVINALSKETSWFTIYGCSCLSVVSSMLFRSFNKCWQLLSTNKRSFLALSSIALTTSSFIFAHWSTSRRFDTWNLRLFDSVNKFFDGFFQEIHFSHFALFIFLDPGLDGIKSCLI